MLYDERGNIISETNPTPKQVKDGLDAYLKKSSGGRARLYGDFTDMPLYFLHPGSHGKLSYNELRALYETSPSVRPAVDSIVREIYNIPWQILHEDQQYHDSQISNIVTKFFNSVNYDNEDISRMGSYFFTDLLVIGKGVIEKVRNIYGDLLELRACNAAYFSPILDSKYNAITGYKECTSPTGGGYDTVHLKNNIIFKTFSTLTYTQCPVPIIETIVNEISLLMLTVKNIGAVFGSDDIPPGILHLGNIGLDALDRAKASFRETKDVSERGFQLKVVDNVDKVDWVQFTRPFREMQLAELIPIIERVVARNFGLAPIDTGLEGGGKTSATLGKQSSKAKMLFPLVKLFESAINNEVLSEIYPGIQFMYFPGNIDNDTEYEKNLQAEVRLGLITINEFRLSVGKKPVRGGDQRFVLLGNEFVPLDKYTGLPRYRLDLAPKPGRPSNDPTEDPTPPPAPKPKVEPPPSGDDVN